MKHFASENFWECYEKLPLTIKKLADKSFYTLKTDPSHPSLHFKKIGKFRSVRIGIHYRALAIEQTEGLLWFWIGNHADYDKLLNHQPLMTLAESKCSESRSVSGIIPGAQRRGRTSIYEP